MSSIGARLTDARVAAGFKNATMAAKHFGWNVYTYCAHENGHRIPRRDNIIKYSKAFDVPTEWLMSGGLRTSNYDAEIGELVRRIYEILKQPKRNP